MANDSRGSKRGFCGVCSFSDGLKAMSFDHTAATGRLRLLYVAYPLLPISEHSPGGAEQVLWTLEREIQSRGFETTIAACAGSQVSGELFATGNQAESVDQFEERAQQQARLV